MLPRGSEEGWRKGKRRKEEIGVYPPIFPPPPPGFPHSCVVVGICRSFPGSLSLLLLPPLCISFRRRKGPNWTFPDSHRRRVHFPQTLLFLVTCCFPRAKGDKAKGILKRVAQRGGGNGESGFSFEKLTFFIAICLRITHVCFVHRKTIVQFVRLQKIL